MADTSPDYYRGLLLPHKMDTTNIWTAQASYTQGDNQSGDPEPGQTGTRLIVRASGSQNAGSDIQITTRSPGHVGRGAGFTWKNNALGDEMGQDPPNSISLFEFLAFDDAGSATDDHKFPYPLDLGDGSILVAAQVTDDGTLYRRILVYKRAADGTLTSLMIKSIDLDAVLAADNHPILIKREDGSILCLFLWEDIEQELVNLSVFRSLDDGATFAEISRTALDSTISLHASTGHTIRRMRGASLGGQILLFVETTFNGSASYINQLFQYSSIDGGGNFAQVTPANLLDDHSFYQIDCFARNNEFILTYIGKTDEAHYMVIPQAFHSAQSLRTASKYEIITGETVAGGSNANMTSGQSTAWTDDDGQIYAVFEDSGGKFLWMRNSEDGRNWRYMNGDFSDDIAKIYDVDDTATIPANIKGISAFGQGLLCCNFDATSASDNSAGIIHLGGYSNVNQPLQITGQKNAVWNRAGFGFTYLPVDLPADIAGIVVAGAGTETLTADGMLLSSSTVQTRSYTVDLQTSITSGMTPRITARIELTTNAKGDVIAPFAAGKREIRIVTGNTAKSYEISIRISNTQYLIYDVLGTAQIGSIQAISGTAGMEFLFGLDGDNFAIWHRQLSLAGSKAWIAGPTSTTVTDGGAAGSAAQMIFSHSIAPASGTLDTTIRSWCGGFSFEGVVSGSSAGIAGQGLGDGFVSPGGLVNAPYPPAGTYKYVDEGLKITTALGPGYEGDTYRIRTKYGFGIDNVFFSNSPTPRIFWRSVAVTSGPVPEQMIPLALDAASQAANQDMGNNLIGVHLSNINFRSFNIEYYDTGGPAWINYKTIDTSEGITFAYERANAAIVGIDGGVNEPYFFQNEARGWIAEIEYGGGPTVERFRVISNSAGKCGSAAYKRPVFRLDGIPGGNGTCRLIPDKITVLANLRTAAGTAWAIRVTAQETPDKWIQIGQLVIGQVVTGQTYSYGRSITLEHNIETYETPDRVQYSRELSGPRRRAQIAWTEGVDISTLMGAAPTPDVWSGSTSSGSEPIASPQDIPYLILGVMDYLQGPSNPCVYLPSIKRSESTGTDAILINRYHDHILCVLDNSEVGIESVLGNESISESGEIFRVANLSLIEVI